MNYVKKLNLHWFCVQNHILEPFSVRRACTKSYVTSEPYPRASQIWCQNVRETWKKKVIKCRGESFARCRVIARNVEGEAPPPPPVFLGLRRTFEKTRFDCVKKEKICGEIAIGNFSKITETAHGASFTEAAYSEHSITIHSISMAGYVTTVPPFVCGELPAREASTFCNKKKSLRFHHIFLLFDSSNFCFLDVLNKDNYS